MPTAELSDEGTEIVISTWYADNGLIQQLPGVGWRDKEKVWKVPLSWPACLTLRELFPQTLTLGPRLTEWGLAWKAYEDTRLQYQSALQVPPGCAEITKSLLPEHLQLFPFQDGGAWWLAASTSALLADEMGSGKTIQAAAGAALAGAYGFALPALIICPASGMRMWKRELAKWQPAWHVELVEGGMGRRRKIIEAGADVLIISWNNLASHTRLAPYASLAAKRCRACGGQKDLVTGESLVSEQSCQVHSREFQAVSFNLVIADEAHRGKDPRTVQTRAFWQVMHQAPRRWALTGTPQESNVGDLWSIFHALDPVAFPGKSKFLDLFATVTHGLWGGMEILGLNPAHADLFHRIKDVYMRRLPKEITLPWLPQKMPPVYRYPQMGAKQKKAYTEMTKDMVAQLEDLLVAPNPLAKLTHQISLASACGSLIAKPCRHCKDHPGWQWAVDTSQYWAGQGEGEWIACSFCKGTAAYMDLELTEPSCKIDDLVEFIGDRGPKPLVVMTVRRQLAELTSKRLEKLKITHGLFTGAQNAVQKQSVVDNFQAGRLQVFLGTVAAGAETITLTASDTIFFMQRHSSLIKDKQAVDRVHRIGSEQHEAINIVYSVTEDTIEDRIIQLQEEKGERFEETVRDRQTLKWLLEG